MRNNISADVVIGLNFGDEGKGKITHHLLQSSEYTHCIRFGGAHNAGHTIYHEGKKHVTHVIPSGVLRGVRSVIGPGCVVNPLLLEKEIQELEAAGLNVRENLFIDKRCHIITEQHLEEDGKDTKIGTTRKGTGPAYRDKHDRKGIRFGDLKNVNVNITDTYEELHNSSLPVVALFEGAQGFGLDIDWGDYPYVTSSTCTVGGAVANGMPAQAIRKVFGVAKAYQTYVGAKKFQPEGDIFNKIREVGAEYGATTGRARQVDYIDLDFLVKSANINGVTNLVINKTDILREVGVWRLYVNNKLEDVKYEDKFVDFIRHSLLQKCPALQEVIFSYSPNDI